MVEPERALGFVVDLGAVTTVERFVRVALAGLARVVPADLWGFNRLDPHSHRMLASIWPEDGARPEQFEAVERAVWEHPVLAHFERTSRGAPTRISDLWDQERYHQSGLYRDAYRDLGVEYQVSFTMSDGPSAAAIAFAANRSTHDFTREELDVLSLLRPPLRSAWQRAQASRTLAVAVERPASGALVLVDDRCRVRAASTEVLAKLARAGLQVGLGEEVGEPLFSWLRRPIPGADLQVGIGRGAVRVSVVAGEPGADRILAAQPARTAVEALTVRELEIIALVAEGRTNTDIAAELEISARTVQKHLERCFDKLGVSNRTAAVAAVRSARVVGSDAAVEVDQAHS